MKPVALIFAGLLLAACEGTPGQTLPDGVSATDVALFKTAVTGAGCSVTTANAAAIEAQTGFDDATLKIITQYLTLAGESEPTADGFRLTSGTCANA